MVAEFNRIGIPFTLDDRWNCGKSMKAFDMWVLANRYANAEVIARKWNGGPNGHKKASTIKYWNKVKKQLQTNKPR